MATTADEHTSLIKRPDFRSVSQRPRREPCGPCARLCTRERLVSVVCGKKDEDEPGTFSSSIGVLLSMLGAVVGTGNIWRFPRIVANHATEGGALTFLMVWAFFLWMWSIPIRLIECGIGRYTRKSTVESFNAMIGPSYRFMGGFQAAVAFCFASYYSVVLGWCGYYFVHTCANPLPATFNESNAAWEQLDGSNWPVLCHGLGILLAALSLSRGVSTIEPINKVVVPVLLFIVVFCFYWALFLDNAAAGIIHMFSPSWSSFKSSQLWLDAISQNAWDTGAGLGTFLTYATYMKRSQGAVKLGTITTIMNNVVSLICGILVFSTVFSVETANGRTTAEIVDVLKDNGPANTGITFIWMPLLFFSIKGGRFLAAIFFISLTLAGLSSLISLMEFVVHVFADFGIRRIPATVAVAIAMFFMGLMSAMDTQILVNQDSVWAYAMILCGCLFIYLVVRYGILRFRRTLYINFGIGDWPLPYVWVLVILTIAPIEGVGLIIWWAVEQIVNNGSTWWQFKVDSLAMVISQWALVMLVMIGLNWWMSPLNIPPPRNPLLRRVGGWFIKFREPRPETPPPAYTPKEISEDDEDEEESIAMAIKGQKYGSSDDSKVVVQDVDL